VLLVPESDCLGDPADRTLGLLKLDSELGQAEHSCIPNFRERRSRVLLVVRGGTDFRGD